MLIIETDKDVAELAKKHKTVEVVTKRAMLTETSLYDRLPEKFLDFVKSSMVPGAEPEGSRKDLRAWILLKRWILVLEDHWIQAKEKI